MDPRLKTSTKWSPFPADLITQIEEVFAESFEDYDLGGKFTAEGAIYKEELLLRVGLPKTNQLRQDNFEASIQYNPEEEKATDKINMLVDFLGQVWETYLEDEPEQEDLPIHWREERFEKDTVFLKYTTVNSSLEAQADKLLEMYDDNLVRDSKDAEDELTAFDAENFGDSADDKSENDAVH